MAGRKNGLGRGLDAFFPDRTSVVKEPARKTITKTVKTEKKSDVAEKQTNPTVAKKQTADSKTGAMIVKISSVEPNMDQPRKQFDEDALMELSESIKQYGVLHPLLVSDKKDYYEIIAGERRWRAAKLAGLTEIPVIVKEFSEQELVEISLIENIQREDLNPVEEAMAYKRLIDEFHLKQDEIAERVGKSRTAVTNAMRLLKLSEKVGRIQMPPEYETYIERFGFFTSTDKVQMCSCSYGDSMVLGITSKIADSNIERNLMHLLQKEGIACEQEENDFPGQKEQPHGTAKLGLKIFSFTCIAAVVLCWMMNFLATPQMWWAGYATAGVFCAWLLIRVGYQKRKNPLKNSMWQLIFIMIGAILWDYATGWIGWSVDFAIPLAVLMNGATMQILARAYKMEVSEYLFYLMQSGAAGIVPAILWLTGTVRITWPSVICVGLSVLYLIGLFFFRGKDFMREMQKKFRV